MNRNIFFVGVLLSSLLFSTQAFASEKQFELSQIPVVFLNKVYKHLQVLKHEEYKVLSISSRGFPGKPNFWIQLNRQSAFHGCMIDRRHHSELLSDVESLYTASGSTSQTAK
jgi:hypothetical protein